MDLCSWLHSLLQYPVANVPRVYELPLKTWRW
jgi:hypothetical protein